MYKPRGKPFPKGTSGNPNGRPPKGSTWNDMINEYLEMTVVVDKKRISNKELITRVLMDRARKGDLKFIETIMDRVMGKPVQKMEVEQIAKPADAVLNLLDGITEDKKKDEEEENKTGD